MENSEHCAAKLVLSPALHRRALTRTRPRKESMTAPISLLTHIALPVRNLAAQLAFY